MVLLGQGMELEGAPAVVQVVYYLSRAGQLQQPHLIDVAIASHSNGVYLRDVKQKLTSIRGKGVADSFSWSCKRNYKDNFIWQDLTDDDKILPLSDGEFVLKGSGLYPGQRLSGKGGFASGQMDPESRSFSPKKESERVQDQVDLPNKYEQEKVNQSSNLQSENDYLRNQNKLASTLGISLQLVNNPHANLRRFSKDSSMDLNQQVMNSLSQAKAEPAEEVAPDPYDMSSNETFFSEESTLRNNIRDGTGLQDRSKSSSLSSRTDLNYELAAGKQGENTPERPISMGNGPKVPQECATGRQEKPESVPSIRTKAKASGGNEASEGAGFILSPRRIMAVLSTPEKKLGKILHSSSVRSSALTNSNSAHSVEPLNAMKLTRQSTCLSQLRFCSQLGPHATDSRPDSPVRQPSIAVLVQSSSGLPKSPPVRKYGGPSWTRWKPGRRSSRASEPIPTAVVLEPSTPARSDPQLPEDKTAGTTTVRRMFTTSFEFDRPADANSSGPGTPSLHTRSSSPTESRCTNSPRAPWKSVKPVSLGAAFTSADTRCDTSDSSRANSSAEQMTPISVKEVITENGPQQQSSGVSDSGESLSDGVPGNGKAGLVSKGSMIREGQDFNIDTSSLPRVSISESIPTSRTAGTVTSGTARPNSPESPLKSDPPCSPIRLPDSQRDRSPNRVMPIGPASFNQLAENGRARARGLVKETAPKDSRFMKDLARELHRPRASSGQMRAVASTKRVAASKSTAPSLGARSISSTLSRSPPRISSMLWEDPPQRQRMNLIDRDERPLAAGRSISDWKKTLEESSTATLPTPDFSEILQECGQCRRTFKPDSLKVHMRSCHPRSRKFPTFNGTTLAMQQ